MEFRDTTAMMTFKISDHTILGDVSKVIELWDKDKFVCSIYMKPHGIQMISKFAMDTSVSHTGLGNKVLETLRITFSEEPISAEHQSPQEA